MPLNVLYIGAAKLWHTFPLVKAMGFSFFFFLFYDVRTEELQITDEYIELNIDAIKTRFKYHYVVQLRIKNK
ncbi:hypothetical protein ACPUVO_00270 [Pseudocolwellia sp. HL-MZ19]|uniref:hypothetical protein n=1 Tax=Pseudocolwellia sp. HL-MZ19 TaxID=3400846 RepID=UPI003CEF97C1